MKVWFPTIRAGSGVDIYINRLAVALGNKGIDVEVTWFDRNYEFAPSLLKRAKPPQGTTIIHSNSWSAFAFKRKNIPLVVTEHHCVLDPSFRPYKNRYQHTYHEILIRRYEKASFRMADKIVAVSNYTANSIQRTFNLSNVEVIHNWVDTDTFTTDNRDEKGNTIFKLLYVGNQSRRKGWDLIPAIMKTLGNSYQLLVTAGLRNRNVGNSQNNIVQLGYLTTSDLVKAYQQCDALLFPSRYEGFGYVALEAMACGKPVITANNSALPEVVVEGVTGLLCEPDNTDCYIAACRRLNENRDFTTRLGNNARQRVLESFAEETQINQYIAAYNTVLSA